MQLRNLSECVQYTDSTHTRFHPGSMEIHARVQLCCLLHAHRQGSVFNFASPKRVRLID
jgi:hypothetical protein